MKLHITPIASNFLNAARKGLEHVQEGRYMHFEGNKASISLMFDYSNPVKGSINSILHKFRAILRKYRSKHFDKLHLHFNKCAEMDQVALYNLSLDLAANCRNLKELSVVFYSCQEMTDQKLGRFIIPITQCLRHLRKLNITLCKCKKITGQGINYINSLMLTRLKRLCSLSINFSPLTTKHDNGRSGPFDPNIAKRNNIDYGKFLMIFELSQYRMSQKAICDFHKNIARYFRNRNFKELTFVSPEYPEIKGCKSAKDLTLSTIQKLKQLKKFYLGFQKFSQLDVGALDEITDCIRKNMIDLQYLTIDFEGYSGHFNISEPELTQTAFNIFSNLSMLRGLALSFGRIEASEEAVVSFTREMCEHAKNLEEFILEVKDGSFVSRSGIEKLIQQLSQNLPSLKKVMLNTLNLAIVGTNNNDETEINCFIQQGCPTLKEFHLLLHNSNYIPLLTSEMLEKLTLSFRDCQRMSDKNFNELIESIFQRPLPYLKELTICCKKASNITDEAFKALFCEDWTDNVNLKVFKLEISDATSITDVALTNMEVFGAEKLKNIKSLQTLSLAFTSCKSLTKRGINHLILSIARNLKDLQELELNFHQGSTSEGFSPEEVSLVIDSIVSNMTALRKVILDFSFIVDRSKPYSYKQGVVFDKDLKEYWKKLNYVSVVEINFGPIFL